MNDPDGGYNAPGPPPFTWQKHSAEENELIRGRQRARAIVMAVLLGAFVVLMFAISIAKIRAGMK